MTAAIMMVLAVGAALAFANGANDAGKGIATLVGSGLTDYRRAIAWGSLNRKTLRDILLAWVVTLPGAAVANGCGYCLSAHTLIGAKMLGVPEEELTRARDRKGNDNHETALLALAVKIVEGRGRISDADLQRARAAGITDPELVEVVASIAALTFSNYINHIARTPIDFPAAINLPAAA